MVQILSFFRRLWGVPRREAPPAMRIPAESRSAFLVCAFSMLGKLAAADGRVTSAEATRVEAYIDARLGLDRKTKAMALKLFHEAADSPLELRDYAEAFKSAYPERVQLLDQMVEILIELSISDGRLSPEEERLLRSAALLLGLSEPGFERIKKKVLPAPPLH